ncbi:hypothetical protein R4Y45_07100 [Holzapfeliella sp. He02]|uniref:Uncharacterized protein n=1 Tax=Holzapfeliella saturejae TaxID=3082953 RepID=A0ABU8SHW8_9LACO
MKQINKFLAISRNQLWLSLFIVGVMILISAKSYYFKQDITVNMLPVFFGAIITMTSLDINFAMQLNLSKKKLTSFIMVLSILQSLMVISALMFINIIFHFKISAMYFDVFTLSDYFFLFCLLTSLYNWFTLFMLIINQTLDVTRYFKLFSLWLVEIIVVVLIASLYNSIAYQIKLNSIILDLIVGVLFILVLSFETYYLYNNLKALEGSKRIELSDSLRVNK